MKPKKIVKLLAKHNCTIYYSKEPYGYSFNKRNLIKNETLELQMVSSHKIESFTLARIFGERNVIFKDGENYVSTYSNDFTYIN